MTHCVKYMIKKGVRDNLTSFFLLLCDIYIENKRLL